MRKYSILACPLRLRMILALACLSWMGSRVSFAEETQTKSPQSAAGSKTTAAKPVTPVLKTLVDLLTGSSSKPRTTTTIEIPGRVDSAAASAPSSHRQSKAIKVEGSKGDGALKTMCLHTNGNILAIVGQSDYRSVGSKPAKSPTSSEIRVYDPNGEPLKSWSVPFPAQAINVSPSGEVFVAGDGRIAKFGPEGKLLSEAALPHVEELMKNADALREQAKERRDSILKSYEQQLRSLQVRKDALTKKKASDGKDDKDKKSATKDPTADAEDSVELFLGGGSEEQQLLSLNSMIRSYESALTDVKKRTVDDYTTELTSRLRKANALAVSDKEVFLACGQIKGYGYSIWRMTHSFKEPKEIVSGLGGCCGQMDVQCCKDELIVAENTRHHVVRFDRDGKKLATFGSRSRSGDGSGFGGCCNPMNTRPGPNGDVFTAESEGVVKRFSASGKFLGSVGSVQLSGGCKNVAVAVSADGKRVYFCDLPGSRILVLDEKKSEGAAQLQ